MKRGRKNQKVVKGRKNARLGDAQKNVNPKKEDPKENTKEKQEENIQSFLEIHCKHSY